MHGRCPDEPQFHEMYAALGDRDAQQEIRLSHPDVEHCQKLEINASACNGCPMNPVKPEKLALRERIEEGSQIINTALDLDELARLGLLTPSAINSEEMLLLRTQRAHADFQRHEQQALLIAAKMAEVLSKMFGGK